MAQGAELNPATLRFCPLCGARLTPRLAPHDGRVQPTCPACGFVYYLHPKLVAGTLPVRAGRVLLTRRAIEPARGRWTFPGGYVDWGEDLPSAARRETREEVELEVELGGLVGVYSYPAAPVVIVVYLATVPAGVEPGANPHEVLEVAFFAPDEIPWEELAFPSTREALQDWVARPGVS
jgi:ADP-ribose pyrophosphatase YjhB (NUDIX family)